MDGLDDFLKGEQQPEAEIETPEVPETPEATEVETPEATVEEPKGPVRDEKGRFAPKGETEGEPPAPIEEPTAVPLKALQEERRKRQELEQRLADFEARLQTPQQPAPTIWEDEQGWQQHFGSEVVSTAVQQATFNARLDMSEMMARQAHSDFEDKKTAFLELLRETPGLYEKAVSDPHPWNFAYQYVSNHERMQQLSAVNVTDLEAKLREQIKAELAAQQPVTPPVPETLADHQSARAGGAQALNVPTLDQILKR